MFSFFIIRRSKITVKSVEIYMFNVHLFMRQTSVQRFARRDDLIKEKQFCSLDLGNLSAISDRVGWCPYEILAVIEKAGSKSFMSGSVSFGGVDDVGVVNQNFLGVKSSHWGFH